MFAVYPVPATVAVPATVQIDGDCELMVTASPEFDVAVKGTFVAPTN
jgi:hypothetical protein